MDPARDYLLLTAALAVGLCLLAGLAWLAALPGRIARRRYHPNARTISRLGWVSILVLPLWAIVLMWSYQRPVEEVRSSIRVPLSRLHARTAFDGDDVDAG